MTDDAEFLEQHRRAWAARSAWLATLPDVSGFTVREPEPQGSALAGLMDAEPPPKYEMSDEQQHTYQTAMALIELENALAAHEAAKAAATEAARPSLRDTAIGRLARGPDAATALAGTTIGRELFKSTRGVRL
jgi:hypothetical protein